MQKQLLSLLFFSLLSTMMFGQLNMSLRSHLQYDTDLNDIWGYVAPDGSEYAIVGLRNGVSIVDVSNPDDAVEVARIPGQNSTWRDIKTWGEYAYVTTDQSGTTEGLTVIDLTNLPESANFFHWTPELPDLGTLQRCHNIYIDEFGYAYLAGCNVNDGGMLFIDVFTTPGTPIFAGPAPNVYAHDVYTENNLMYASEIYEGDMTIYDVTDKDEVIELGRQETPFVFTHNIWLSDNEEVAFTTDERANAPIGSYDVSDPSDIVELDQFRPTATLGSDVIPHNVHVWQDWLIISYYTDGGIIVDAARPDNLIEVGNFDTFFGAGAGFNGVWGAYPFLPSGIVLLSDIGDGLYVLDANYVRACYLEGDVTDAVTGAQISGAEIIISGDEPNIDYSRLDGSYGTGIATPGTAEVTVFKPGYQLFTAQVNLDNGVVTELDVPLQPLPRFSPGGMVVEEGTNTPVEGAQIIMIEEFSTFEFQSDGSGAFVAADIYEGMYDVYVSRWGYNTQVLSGVVIEDGGDLGVFELPRGYKDDFITDQGWVATADANTRSGGWERGEPIGTVRFGQTSNPEFDIEGDLGDLCYVTGNGGGTSADDDVDGAAVYLTSPVMELASIYVDPVLTYSPWFFNDGNNEDDALEIFVSNGTETVSVEEITSSASFWRDPSEILLSEFITVTDEMTVQFVTSDDDPNGDIVEAAIDGFEITGELVVNTKDPVLNVNWTTAPNPFTTTVRLSYQLPEWQGDGQLKVVNALGQVVEQRQLQADAATYELGADWPKGVYFIQLEIPEEGQAVQRVVKQ